jgi:hypothetical protein
VSDRNGSFLPVSELWILNRFIGTVPYNISIITANSSINPRHTMKGASSGEPWMECKDFINRTTERVEPGRYLGIALIQAWR